MAIEYKRIAASRPAVTTEAALYAVPAGTEVVGQLTVVNQNTSPVTFRVAHTDVAGAATGEDWVAYDEPLEAKERRVLHLSMGPLETVRIQASVADVVSFVLDGMIKT
jgi:hypothetical protein